MKIGHLFVACSCSVFIACAGAQERAAISPTLDAVEAEFLATVGENWDAYSICEYKEKRTPPSYLNRLFPNTRMPEESDISTRHLVLRQQGEADGFDLSIYLIRFAADQQAQQAVSELSGSLTGTVADGKVLTKYAVRVKGPAVHVIRTQSVLDPAMNAFLEAFSQ